MKHLFLTDLAMPIRQWQDAFSNSCLCANQSSDIDWTQIGFVWLMDNFASGMTIVKSLHNQKIPVVVMSLTPNAKASVAFFEQGASGYCHALAEPVLLNQIVESIEAGGIWLGAELMQQVIQQLPAKEAKSKANLASLSLLTTKEKQVADWVAKGLTNKEVAKELEITDRTVKAHLASIFEKLDVRDRIQLALLLN
jgi:DNA-binding NarL/FixJ family response regulator